MPQYYQAHWRKEVGAARRQLENFLGGGVDVGPLEEALVACGLASGNKASVGHLACPTQPAQHAVKDRPRPRGPADPLKAQASLG